MKKIVFLGGGRITNALIAGLRLAKDHHQIVVHDRHPEKLRELKALYKVQIEPDLQSAVDKAGLLIVAVRPASVSELLRSIRIDRPLPAVSLAAGIPFANLRRDQESPVHWARAIPTPGCRVRLGLTSLTFDRGFPQTEKIEIRALFASVSTVLEIPESKVDLFTVVSSPSHGYHAMSALVDGITKLGLDRNAAITCSAHALADAITTWRMGKDSLDELLHEAATPGGIAAATMQDMNRAGYQRAIDRGLKAGLNRARKNAKLA